MWHTTGTSHRTLKDALCNCVVSLLLSEAAFCDLQILKKTRIQFHWRQYCGNYKLSKAL